MNENPDSPPRQGDQNLLRLIVPLLAVLIGVALWRGQPVAEGSNEPHTQAPAVAGPVVYLEVNGPGLDPLDAQATWQEGLTVRDATEAAIPSVWSGKGTMSFLDELSGVPNQGGGGLNWQFEVNGEYSHRGAGDFPLAPGDRVLWELAPNE